MKTIRHICFFLTFLLVAGLTSGQSVLKGRVLSKEGEPVEYATVMVLDQTPPLGCKSNAKGGFSLTIPSEKEMTLKVSASGYKAVEFSLKLSKGQNFDTIIRLSLAVIENQEVVVHGEKDRTTSFTQIDAERMERMAGPSTGVEALIKTLPDVQSNNELSSQYSVRGGSFDENLVYVNGVEVYRPMLIRSGQQEGMSIINPDMVDNIFFSPGGFDAGFGDKMSSVLDINYKRPNEFKTHLSASLLGASASTQGVLGKDNRWAYAVGFRQRSNSYLFRTLDTKGVYHTNYMDLQALLTYRASEQLDVSALFISSRNIYGLIPESQSTLTGGLAETMKFMGYFDGQEEDRYRTTLGAVTFDFHPTSDFQLKWITSAQRNMERELYDIQCQYWLYEVNVGTDSLFERGVGTYLEHARNYLTSTILSSELKGTRFVSLGQWDFGAKFDREMVDDKVREWRWVDSAGYAFPVSDHGTPGDPNNEPVPALLQNFCSAHNQVATNRYSAFAQRQINLYLKQDDELRFMLGVRSQYYDVYDQALSARMNSDLLVSPRASVSYKPKGRWDVVYRLAAGIYHQPPFYREYRRDDGSLNFDVTSMHSYQVMGTADWNLKIYNKPFRLTTDIYYKYITDLVPYRIDNLRVRYDANNQAVAYATGLSVRLAGDLVEGLESWASLSLMKTQEDILTDTLGWLSRPTDQRFSLKVFLQDYVPNLPFWRMSLNLVFGSRMPYTSPRQKDRSLDNRMPSYYRIDWSNTVELAKFERLKNAKVFQYVDDINLAVEVFNLFDYHNAVSYTWVADYSNQYYHIPNYLTGRQLNVKLTVTF